VLFVLMVLLPPWNHDYYYIFLLTPLTISLRTALARTDRRYPAAALVLLAYVMMSPPVPFGLIDRLGWVDGSFAHAWNVAGWPLYGGLLLLGVCTWQWLAAGAPAPRSAATSAL
jgi:hypothetical protein